MHLLINERSNQSKKFDKKNIKGNATEQFNFASIQDKISYKVSDVCKSRKDVQHVGDYVNFFAKILLTNNKETTLQFNINNDKLLFFVQQYYNFCYVHVPLFVDFFLQPKQFMKAALKEARKFLDMKP